jgi:inosine/xanthosine triphosphate pyrophosphatase family protein
MFIPEGFDKTRGELTKEEYDQTSPRLQAIKKLEKFLSTK